MFRSSFIAGSLFTTLCMPLPSIASSEAFDIQPSASQTADTSTIPGWIKQRAATPIDTPQTSSQPAPPPVPDWVKERPAPPAAMGAPTPPEPPPLPAWVKPLPATETDTAPRDTGTLDTDTDTGTLAETTADQMSDPAKPAPPLPKKADSERLVPKEPPGAEETMQPGGGYFIPTPAMPFNATPLPPIHSPRQPSYGGWPHPHRGWQRGRVPRNNNGDGGGYGYQGHQLYRPPPLFIPRRPHGGPLAPPVNR